MMWRLAALTLILGAAAFIATHREVTKVYKTDAMTEAGIVNQAVNVEVSSRPVAVAIPLTVEPLEKYFAMPELPATEKAHLIDLALASEDLGLKARAENLLYSMVQSGSVADVLAALPRASYVSAAALGEVAKLQESLCRFQNSPEDEFGFEVIKAKFNLIIGKGQEIKSWQTLCKG